MIIYNVISISFVHANLSSFYFADSSFILIPITIITAYQEKLAMNKI